MSVVFPSKCVQSPHFVSNFHFVASAYAFFSSAFFLVLSLFRCGPLFSCSFPVSFGALFWWCQVTIRYLVKEKIFSAALDLLFLWRLPEEGVWGGVSVLVLPLTCGQTRLCWSTRCRTRPLKHDICAPTFKNRHTVAFKVQFLFLALDQSTDEWFD